MLFEKRLGFIDAYYAYISIYLSIYLYIYLYLQACLQTCADRLIAETCQCYREDFIENYPESDSTDLRKCVKSADPNSCECLLPIEKLETAV